MTDVLGGEMLPEDQRFPVVLSVTNEYLIWVDGTSYKLQPGETLHERAARAVTENSCWYELIDGDPPVGGDWSAEPAADWQVEHYGPYSAQGCGPRTATGGFLSDRAIAAIDAERRERVAARTPAIRTVHLPAEDVPA